MHKISLPFRCDMRKFSFGAAVLAARLEYTCLGTGTSKRQMTDRYLRDKFVVGALPRVQILSQRIDVICVKS